MLAMAMMTGLTAPLHAADAPLKVVALGDSLTAGYGLPPQDAFPVKLEKALAAKGVAAEIANAGVSGDTSTGGAARFDWSVPPGTQAVILELGANDMLRGTDPKITRKALDGMLAKLKERRIPVLLCGMRAAPNMGVEFAKAYNAIFPELAETYGALYVPFFLDGVTNVRGMTLGDGLHPSTAGVDTIVQRVLPKAEELIARAKAARGT